MTKRTPVIIESPFAGDRELNDRYLHACIHDSIVNHCEAPFASHAMYTKALDDNIPAERQLGMNCGFVMLDIIPHTVVYTDLGISNGMKAGINEAKKRGNTIEYRQLPSKVLRLIKGDHSPQLKLV